MATQTRQEWYADQPMGLKPLYPTESPARGVFYPDWACRESAKDTRLLSCRVSVKDITTIDARCKPKNLCAPPEHLTFPIACALDLLSYDHLRPAHLGPAPQLNVLDTETEKVYVLAPQLYRRASLKGRPCDPTDPLKPTIIISWSQPDSETGLYPRKGANGEAEEITMDSCLDCLKEGRICAKVGLILDGPNVDRYVPIEKRDTRTIHDMLNLPARYIVLTPAKEKELLAKAASSALSIKRKKRDSPDGGPDAKRRSTSTETASLSPTILKLTHTPNGPSFSIKPAAGAQSSSPSKPSSSESSPEKPIGRRQFISSLASRNQPENGDEPVENSSTGDIFSALGEVAAKAASATPAGIILDAAVAPGSAAPHTASPNSASPAAGEVVTPTTAASTGTDRSSSTSSVATLVDDDSVSKAKTPWVFNLHFRNSFDPPTSTEGQKSPPSTASQASTSTSTLQAGRSPSSSSSDQPAPNIYAQIAALVRKAEEQHLAESNSSALRANASQMELNRVMAEKRRTEAALAEAQKANEDLKRKADPEEISRLKRMLDESRAETAKERADKEKERAEKEKAWVDTETAIKEKAAAEEAAKAQAAEKEGAIKAEKDLASIRLTERNQVTKEKKAAEDEARLNKAEYFKAKEEARREKELREQAEQREKGQQERMHEKDMELDDANKKLKSLGAGA